MGHGCEAFPYEHRGGKLDRSVCLFLKLLLVVVVRASDHTHIFCLNAEGNRFSHIHVALAF